MSVKTDSPAEFLLAAARQSGVACSTVKDGHVLVFTKKKLEDILQSCRDQEEVILFVKRQDFQS